MTTIRATCPDCGDIVTTPDRVAVTRTWHGHATWRTTCQHCGQPVIRLDADLRTIRRLERAGAWQNHQVTRPRELDDRGRHTKRSPIDRVEHVAFLAAGISGRLDEALANLTDQHQSPGGNQGTTP